MDAKTYAVSAPVKVDITLNDGTVYHLKAGLNSGVPEDVATHWYAKASGCTAIDEDAQREAEAKAKAKADGKASKKGVKTEDDPTLAERAAAVGLDDISGLSEDEALKLVEEAEAKAKADS
ncbi:MAG: hypothetical protein K2X84_07360 [Beijerinckiaceae bacterium]|nr:hypothetical protein [Beijerinckiaceae bacterium]